MTSVCGLQTWTERMWQVRRGGLEGHGQGAGMVLNVAASPVCEVGSRNNLMF